jgi:hypothetical protein
VGGLAVGIATSWLQGVLPTSANVLANSGAIWSLIACALSLPAHSRPFAIAAGLLALGGEVAGYYAIASPVRGITTSASERLLWTVAALVIGPLVGLAAWSIRAGRPSARAVALGALGGLLIGEGLHRLIRLSSDDVAGWIAVGVGFVGALAGQWSAPRRSGRDWLAWAAALVLLTGLTYAAYGHTSR